MKKVLLMAVHGYMTRVEKGESLLGFRNEFIDFSSTEHKPVFECRFV